MKTTSKWLYVMFLVVGCGACGPMVSDSELEDIATESDAKEDTLVAATKCKVDADCAGLTPSPARARVLCMENAAKPRICKSVLPENIPCTGTRGVTPHSCVTGWSCLVDRRVNDRAMYCRENCTSPSEVCDAPGMTCKSGPYDGCMIPGSGFGPCPPMLCTRSGTLTARPPGW